MQDKEIGKFTVPSTAVTPQEENIGIVTIDIIQDSVNNMVGNISNLAMYEDNNEVDLELCYKEVIEDASVT